MQVFCSAPLALRLGLPNICIYQITLNHPLAPPRSSASNLFSSSLTSHSRSSDSDASLWASSTAPIQSHTWSRVRGI